MKRKVFVCFIIFNVILASITLYSAFAGILWLLGLIMAVITLEVYSYLGYYLQKKYKRKMIINPKDDIERNFDRLVIGDATSIIETKDNALYLTSYNSNFITDCELIKRYYSFVKNGGYIDLYINRGNKFYFNCKSIDPFSYDLLHKVTLYENGINKLRFYRGLMICSITFPIIVLFRKKHLTNKYDDSELYFVSISDFCNKRMIKLQVYI